MAHNRPAKGFAAMLQIFAKGFETMLPKIFAKGFAGIPLKISPRWRSGICQFNKTPWEATSMA